MNATTLLITLSATAALGAQQPTCQLQLSAGNIPLTASSGIALTANGTTMGGFAPVQDRPITVTPQPSTYHGCAGVTWMVVAVASDPTWFLITSVPTGGESVQNVNFAARTNPSTFPRGASVGIQILSGAVVSPVPYFTVVQDGSTEPLQFRQVRALYQSILGRDPDQAGFQFWTSQGLSVGQLAGLFASSPEFTQKYQ